MLRIVDTTPEEIIRKVKSGEISSRTYNSHDEFVKALREEQ